MILRLIVECIAYNVAMNIVCHKDTECVISEKEIELKITSARVRDKIKAFCQFTRVGVKEYIIVHKLVISRESKKVFAKTFNNQ